MVKPTFLRSRTHFSDWDRVCEEDRGASERPRDVNGSGNAPVPPSPCSPVTLHSVPEPGFAHTPPNPQSLREKKRP
ncbi:hypothetical protein AGIG_G21672 [Arapaima gigas]